VANCSPHTKQVINAAEDPLDDVTLSVVAAQPMIAKLKLASATISMFFISLPFPIHGLNNTTREAP
jgi:hypothetical protein